MSYLTQHADPTNSAMSTDWPPYVSWGCQVQVMTEVQPYIDANMRGFARHSDGSLLYLVETADRSLLLVAAHRVLIAQNSLGWPGLRPVEPARPMVPAGGIEIATTPWWVDFMAPAPTPPSSPSDPMQQVDVPLEKPVMGRGTAKEQADEAGFWSSPSNTEPVGLAAFNPDMRLIDDIQFGNKRIDGKVQTACTLMGLTTVGDARRVKDKHFLRLPNFGPESLASLRAIAPFKA